MNIFGFTITKTSKKKQEEKELEIFEKCVDTMDKVTVIGKKEIQAEPNAYSVQSVGAVQEHLESLIEIYTNNKFSRPTNTFELANLIQKMRETYVEYIEAISRRECVLNRMRHIDFETFDDCEYETFGADLIKLANQSSKKLYDAYTKRILYAAKEYFMSLNMIRHVIIYDITRIATGVDIIGQYHETKGYTIPEKGILYNLSFKKLSRDEINAQIKPKEENKMEV